MKGIYHKHRANITFSDEIEEIPQKLGTKKGCQLLLLLFTIALEIQVNAMIPEK